MYTITMSKPSSPKHKDNHGTRLCNRMTEDKKCDFVGCTFAHSVWWLRFITCRDNLNCKKLAKQQCSFYHDVQQPFDYLEQQLKVTYQTHPWMFRHPALNYEYQPPPVSFEEEQFLHYSLTQDMQTKLKLSDEEIENEMDECLNEIEQREWNDEWVRKNVDDLVAEEIDDYVVFA